jgi:hypothetical protein
VNSRWVTPRAGSHPDRGGDPLDGLVNLFDLGVVLAVAFLLAALSSLNLQGLLTRGGKPVTAGPNQRVRPVNPSGGRVIGRGQPVGTVYRLSDGRLVYVEGR